MKVESSSYFTNYEFKRPEPFAPQSRLNRLVLPFLMGATIASGALYIHWRWVYSLNPEYFAFSVIVATAELLLFIGTIIFFFDIWAERDSQADKVTVRQSSSKISSANVKIDTFIATKDEHADLVNETVRAAKSLDLPAKCSNDIYILDDGDRPSIRELAEAHGVKYLSRRSSAGFKAGNLRHGLYNSAGDFIIILDADTRVFPSFVLNTIGYFEDPDVSWVQTPHWFYDVPKGVPVRFSQLKCFHNVFSGIGKLLDKALPGLRLWSDPYLVKSDVFFDIIQRRRNRNGASFCCGAGSIHRRDSIFSTSISKLNSELFLEGKKYAVSDVNLVAGAMNLQPFRFHVSEDIYTSIVVHSDRKSKWKSVYHPQVEAGMLSPWSLEAWAVQKLKYAGGTYSIMLYDNPILKRGMPLAVKLHYLATFWSYLGIFWLPILVAAPIVSLMFGISPMKTYSYDFFYYFIPSIVFAELTLIAGCKGYNVNNGRLIAISTLGIQFKAFWQVLKGEVPKFTSTPKIPLSRSSAKFIFPNIVIVAISILAIFTGHLRATIEETPDGWRLFYVNAFWILLNIGIFGKMILAYLWKPEYELGSLKGI